LYERIDPPCPNVFIRLLSGGFSECGDSPVEFFR